MLKFARFLAALVLALTVLCGLHADDNTGGKKKKRQIEPAPGATLGGIIKAVAADGKQFTLEIAGNKKKETPASTFEIKLTDATKIEYTGIDSKDEQKLKPGYGVFVTFTEDSKEIAKEVQVRPAPTKKKKDKGNA